MSDLPVFRFKHQYFKLVNFIFPTCRGKTSLRKYPIDTIVEIDENNIISKAVVLDAQIRRIEDLTFSFIRLDGSYPGHMISDHHDFVALLNSFRRFNKIQSIEEEVGVFWLMKVPDKFNHYPTEQNQSFASDCDLPVTEVTTTTEEEKIEEEERKRIREESDAESHHLDNYKGLEPY